MTVATAPTGRGGGARGADAPDVADTLLRWYAAAARDLPWRRPDTSPWAVLVSEVMLQQTQVSRVVPAYEAWLARWPLPSHLAAATPGDAVRQWGGLGYPRRALRLHATAVVIDRDHQDRVPDDPAALMRLPGVGRYTANAVAAFAYGRHVPVVDTNVRRVVSRVLRGRAPAGSGTSAADLADTASLLPAGPTAAAVSVALMELGALVCGARAPQCPQCPLAGPCRWRAATMSGATPGPPAARRRSASFEGSRRQARGRMLASLRAADGLVAVQALVGLWPDPAEAQAALDSLLTDGLAVSWGTSVCLPT